MNPKENVETTAQEANESTESYEAPEVVEYGRLSEQISVTSGDHGGGIGV